MVSKNQTFTIYFPKDKLHLMETIEESARKRRRSTSFVVVELLEGALKEGGEDEGQA